MTGVSVATTGLDVHGPWTVADLDTLPDDGRRYELVDGSLLVSPAPALRHQGVTKRLVALLDAACGPEWEAVEASNLMLRSTPTERLLIPDVLLVRAETVWSDAVRVGPGKVRLVVEVVSPSSVAIDRLLKPALYAEAGVPAYWRVETDPLTVVVHRLVEGVYVETAAVPAGGELALDDPCRLVLRPADLVGRRPPAG